MKLSEYKLDNWISRKIKRQKKLLDKKIILLSLKGASPRTGSKNLLAIDNEDTIIWIADLPTEVYDSYYDMKFENGVIYGRSSNSFMSEINPETGEIIKSYMVN